MVFPVPLLFSYEQWQEIRGTTEIDKVLGA